MQADGYEAKQLLLRAHILEKRYDGILITNVNNFAAFTAGLRNYVPEHTDKGLYSMLVMKDGTVYIVANNIEMKRAVGEEFVGKNVQTVEFPWYDDSKRVEALEKLTSGKNIVSDDGSVGNNVDGELAGLRSLLTPSEVTTYEELGRRFSRAMTQTCAGIKKGMTEGDIHFLFDENAAKNNLHLTVNLIATGKGFNYRHPLYISNREVEDYVMLVGCARLNGLITSMTRFAAVDNPPKGTAENYSRIVTIDANMMNDTLPEKRLDEHFAWTQIHYQSVGMGDEWMNHHQGGPCGYGERTGIATQNNKDVILDPAVDSLIEEYFPGTKIRLAQAFAWNPSGPGVKSEDTFILMPDGSKKIITLTPAFPKAEFLDNVVKDTSIQKSGIMRVV